MPLPGVPRSRSTATPGRLGVQSVEIGWRVVQAMIDLARPAILKTVAERAGMSSPKALRYLVSYCRAGVAVQDPVTGAYRLGPAAVQLGLSALHRLDVVEVIAPELAGLRDRLQCTVGLSVWGNHGPTFVHVAECSDVTLITVRAGTVMPVLSSASGRVYGAYMSAQTIAPFIRAERATARLSPASGAERVLPTKQAIEALFAQVRRNAAAHVKGEMNIGVHALAVPVFDHSGNITASLAALGAAGSFDAEFDGAVAQELMRSARQFSSQLGNPAPSA